MSPVLDSGGKRLYSSGTGYAVTIRTDPHPEFFRLHNTGVSAVAP